MRVNFQNNISNNLSNNVSFSGKHARNYTEHEKAVMKDIRRAAIRLQWKDIYTGNTFAHNKYNPSIEHLIPYSSKDEPEVKEKIAKGFKLNYLDNILPVSRLENCYRRSESIVDVIIKDPKVLIRLLDEMEKYKAYKSDLVDGQEWYNRLFKTVSDLLTGLCSDIKTRNLSIHK